MKIKNVKKKVTEVRKWKKKIKDKVKENKLDKEVGDVLWGVLEDSANYSFNKSHSIAYAALAAITVYLKFKYPNVKKLLNSIPSENLLRFKVS